MNSFFSKTIKMFLMTFLISFMCFFLVTSLSFMKVGIFSEAIGYEMYGAKDENAEMQVLYTYYFDDGDDEKLTQYEKDGYRLSKLTIYSEVDKTVDVTLSVISQILCVMITFLLVYNIQWKWGNRDKELVKLHGMKEIKLKGLYSGLLAITPMFLFLTFAVLTKNSICSNLSVAIYSILNGYAFDIITFVSGNAKTFADIGFSQILTYYAVLLIYPLSSMIAYAIGYKDIVIKEKLIYKNVKNKEI